MTALDPDDPGVADEIRRRLESGDFQVVEGIGIEKPPATAARTRFWAVLILVFLAFLALSGAMSEQALWWWGCVAFMSISTLVVVVVFRVFSSAPSRRLRIEELAHQVRLSQMAARNGYRYHAESVPGDSLYSQQKNPLRRSSILRGLTTNNLCDVGDDFLCGTTGRKRLDDPEQFPAQWGNLTLYHPPGTGRPADETTTAFRGWYLVVALPREVPHIVVDAKSDNKLGTDSVVSLDPHQRVRTDAGFGSRFTVYAPQGYDADARDLFSDTVRRQLLAVADGVNIELVNDAVVFFARSPMDWRQPDSWVLMAQLRSLVQAVMYPRIGEYIDTHQPKPRNKTGEVYQLLSGKPPAPQIAAKGRVLTTSNRLNWATALVAVLMICLLFGLPLILQSLQVDKVFAQFVMVCLTWVVVMVIIIAPHIHYRPRRDRTLR